MSKLPWTKEMSELKRYDWLSAVCVHPVHMDKPRDLRIANALMQHMNADTGIAFPSQPTLAAWARCGSDRQVREGLVSLERTKAIKRVRMQDLQPETLEIVMALGHRTMRAVVYRLNMFWAYETFEAYSFRISRGIGDDGSKITARLHKRPESDRYERPESGRYKPASVRPTNTVEDTVVTLGSAGSKGTTIQSLVGNEGGIDPLVLIPPDDPVHARKWLTLICTDRTKISWALQLYSENKLTAEIIKELAA